MLNDGIDSLRNLVGWVASDRTLNARLSIRNACGQQIGERKICVQASVGWLNLCSPMGKDNSRVMAANVECKGLI